MYFGVWVIYVGLSASTQPGHCLLPIQTGARPLSDPVQCELHGPDGSTSLVGVNAHSLGLSLPPFLSQKVRWPGLLPRTFCPLGELRSNLGAGANRYNYYLSSLENYSLLHIKVQELGRSYRS